MWKSIMAAFSPHDSGARKARISQLEHKQNDARSRAYTELMTLEDVTRKVIARFEGTHEPAKRP